jgi:hypothetical protein
VFLSQLKTVMFIGEPQVVLLCIYVCVGWGDVRLLLSTCLFVWPDVEASVSNFGRL